MTLVTRYRPFERDRRSGALTPWKLQWPHRCLSLYINFLSSSRRKTGLTAYNRVRTRESHAPNAFAWETGTVFIGDSLPLPSSRSEDCRTDRARARKGQAKYQTDLWRPGGVHFAPSGSLVPVWRPLLDRASLLFQKYMQGRQRTKSHSLLHVWAASSHRQLAFVRQPNA